jgi:hypothetical protein
MDIAPAAKRRGDACQCISAMQGYRATYSKKKLTALLLSRLPEQPLDVSVEELDIWSHAGVPPVYQPSIRQLNYRTQSPRQRRTRYGSPLFAGLASVDLHLSRCPTAVLLLPLGSGGIKLPEELADSRDLIRVKIVDAFWVDGDTDAVWCERECARSAGMKRS